MENSSRQQYDAENLRDDLTIVAHVALGQSLSVGFELNEVVVPIKIQLNG